MAEHKHESNQHKARNCSACIYFYITYDLHFPYGCRGAGFKSRLLPSLEMYANSGVQCQLFKEKARSERT